MQRVVKPLVDAKNSGCGDSGTIVDTRHSVPVGTMAQVELKHSACGNCGASGSWHPSTRMPDNNKPGAHLMYGAVKEMLSLLLHAR